MIWVCWCYCCTNLLNRMIFIDNRLIAIHCGHCGLMWYGGNWLNNNTGMLGDLLALIIQISIASNRTVWIGIGRRWAPYPEMMWIIDQCIALHHIGVVVETRHIRWEAVLWVGTGRCLPESLTFISLPWESWPTPSRPLSLHWILIHHSGYD